MSSVLSYLSFPFSPPFYLLVCRACSLPVWQPWTWRDSGYLGQPLAQSTGPKSCAKPLLPPWAEALRFCGERHIAELPRGGMLPWQCADKGGCWAAWRSHEAALGVCVPPLPWLYTSFLRRLTHNSVISTPLALGVAGSSPLWGVIGPPLVWRKAKTFLGYAHFIYKWGSKCQAGRKEIFFLQVTCLGGRVTTLLDKSIRDGNGWTQQGPGL